MNIYLTLYYYLFIYATVVIVSFGKDQYEFSEGDECLMIPIVVNRAVARDFTIKVFRGRFLSFCHNYVAL